MSRGDGRVTVSAQTEPIVETLEAEMTELCTETQTDAIHEAHVPKSAYMSFKNVCTGDDKATQLLPFELFDINSELRPIVENVAEVIIEQVCKQHTIN